MKQTIGKTCCVLKYKQERIFCFHMSRILMRLIFCGEASKNCLWKYFGVHKNMVLQKQRSQTFFPVLKTYSLY